jgi:hypothetical protein
MYSTEVYSTGTCNTLYHRMRVRHSSPRLPAFSGRGILVGNGGPTGGVRLLGFGFQQGHGKVFNPDTGSLVAGVSLEVKQEEYTTMIKKLRPSLTNGLTRRKTRVGIDPKRIVIFFLVSIMAMHRFVWLVLMPSNEKGTLSDIHNLDSARSKARAAAGSTVAQGSDSSSSRLNFVPSNSRKKKKNPQQGPLDPALPKWIRDYINWHREIRSKYPREELFKNPDAPNVIVRTCLGLCGGLNDRLGQLPWDLYLANQTRRVLFLRWYRPKPIEDFLLPNAFNWSMPPDLPGFSRLQEVKHTITEFFEGFDDARPTDDFWKSQLDQAIYRANHGEFKDVKILRHRILGHLNEHELEARLKALGENDMLHSTPSFGKIFWLFFRPVPAIEMELEDVYDSLDLAPGKYSAVHCRVRHPKAFEKHIGV